MNPAERPSRRRGSRYPIRLKARLAQRRYARDESPEPVGEAWTQNISGRGICLEMDNTLAPGALLVVTLDWPMPAPDEPVTMYLYCRVVRVVDQDNRRGVGATIERYEFKRTTPEAGIPPMAGGASA